MPCKLPGACRFWHRCSRWGLLLRLPIYSTRVYLRDQNLCSPALPIVTRHPGMPGALLPCRSQPTLYSPTFGLANLVVYTGVLPYILPSTLAAMLDQLGFCCCLGSCAMPCLVQPGFLLRQPCNIYLATIPQAVPWHPARC